MCSWVRVNLFWVHWVRSGAEKRAYLTPSCSRFMVETIFYTEDVAGSNPAPPTNEIKALSRLSEGGEGHCAPFRAVPAVQQGLL